MGRTRAAANAILGVVDARTFTALSSPRYSGLLLEAVRSFGHENEFALGTRLRRDYPPEFVAAALTQARLRVRAAESGKADRPDAERMFFTVGGYEQATKASVARHRATRMTAALGAGRPVADLCCGIGGDLVALARAGLDVTGVDTDALAVAVARANVAALGLDQRARVIEADATTVARTAFAAVTCDPARRTAQRRVFAPHAYQPPWSFVETLLSETACVKAAPGIPHDRVPVGIEAEWVSDDGEVKEAALWSAALATPGVRRRATLLPSGVTVTDESAPDGASVRPPGRYLYEPDGAVIRAGLVTAVAKAVRGWLLDTSIAYVSSDHATDTPLARGYQVTDLLPYDVRKLRAYVRTQRIGTVTVKKRGVGVEPEKLRAALRPRGDTVVTLVVTRSAGRAVVLVAQPLGQTRSHGGNDETERGHPAVP